MSTNKQIFVLIPINCPLIKKCKFADKKEQTTKFDPIKAFATECLTSNYDSTITVADLYQAFVEYCKRNEVTAPSKNLLGRRLQENIPSATKQRSNTGRYWQGIRLLDETLLPEPTQVEQARKKEHEKIFMLS